MRWNRKEAEGKPLARRTRIAHEAVTVGEKAHIFKARYWYGRRGRKGGEHKREGHAHYLGGLWSCLGLPLSRGCGMGRQKSAEAIVGC